MIQLRNAIGALGHIVAARVAEMERTLTRSSPDKAFGRQRMLDQLREQMRGIGALLKGADDLGREVKPALVGYLCAIATGAQLQVQFVAWLNMHESKTLGATIDAADPWDYTTIARAVVDHYAPGQGAKP